MTTGARPIASNGNSDTPLKTKYLRMPASRPAIGVATTAIAVNMRGSGAVEPRPIMTATSERQTSVVGQPVITKKIAISVKLIAALMPLSAAMRRERYRGARHWRGGRVPSRSASRLLRYVSFLLGELPLEPGPANGHQTR